MLIYFSSIFFFARKVFLREKSSTMKFTATANPESWIEGYEISACVLSPPSSCRFAEEEIQERMKVTRNRKNNQTKQTLEENEEIWHKNKITIKLYDVLRANKFKFFVLSFQLKVPSWRTTHTSHHNIMTRFSFSCVEEVLERENLRVMI